MRFAQRDRRKNALASGFIAAGKALTLRCNGGLQGCARKLCMPIRSAAPSDLRIPHPAATSLADREVRASTRWFGGTSGLVSRVRWFAVAIKNCWYSEA